MKTMNLKRHTVGFEDRSEVLFSPADIQGYFHDSKVINHKEKLSLRKLKERKKSLFPFLKNFVHSLLFFFSLFFLSFFLFFTPFFSLSVFLDECEKINASSCP